MFIFYFCLKQQYNHCIRPYDYDFDCDYDKKIRYKHGPKVYLSMEKSCSNCFFSFFFFSLRCPKKYVRSVSFPCVRLNAAKNMSKCQNVPLWQNISISIFLQSFWFQSEQCPDGPAIFKESYLSSILEYRIHAICLYTKSLVNATFGSGKKSC